MPLKVLYVGGTGQISFDCVHRSVAAGHETSVFNRGNSGADLPEGARRIIGDINKSSYDVLGHESFDVLCQFRAFTPDDVQRDIDLFAGKVGQYVFISSASAYQKPPRAFVVTEDVPLENPFNEYSRLKTESEALLTAQSRLPYTIVRPSHTFRTRLPSALGEGFLAPRRMLQGKPIVAPGDGSSFWTITRAEDFATPFVNLLGNDRALAEAFHITADRAFTWDQIYRGIGLAVGADPTLVHVPSDTLVRYNPDWLGALTGDKANSMIFDNSKVKSVAGDFACHADLEGMFDLPLQGFQAGATRTDAERDLDALLDRIAADQQAIAG